MIGCKFENSRAECSVNGRFSKPGDLRAGSMTPVGPDGILVDSSPSVRPDPGNNCSCGPVRCYAGR